MEFLLALEHDDAVRQILRLVFGRQYTSGAFPQWFMLEPYGMVEGSQSHGDIPIWPLKALCDYIECTDDTAFLSEPVPWRDGTGESSIAGHCQRLIAHLQAQFIPGTHLVRLGEGDWNDSLQPAGSGAEGLDRQQLDRWPLLSTAPPLCRNPAAGGRDRRCEPARRTGRGHARRFQPAPHPRWHTGGLRCFQSRRPRARASATPFGPQDRRELFADPDELCHRQRHVQRRTGAGPYEAHPRAFAFPRWRQAHGPAAALPGRA